MAAHADDEVIGAGGTMAHHAGDEVMVGVLSVDRDPELDQTRRREAAAAWDLLGVSSGEFAGLPSRPLEAGDAAVAAVCEWLRSWRPTAIYLPHPRESDPDHQVVTAIIRNAMLRTRHSGLLLGYEVWTPLTTYHVTQDITEQAGLKRQAITAYESQVAHVAWDEGALGLNRYRGTTSGQGQWCEVFQVMTL